MDHQDAVRDRGWCSSATVYRAHRILTWLRITRIGSGGFMRFQDRGLWSPEHGSQTIIYGWRTCPTSLFVGHAYRPELFGAA